MHSLATALTLTLTLTLTLSLNHLANKKLQSSNALYNLINGSARRIYVQLLVDIETLWRHLLRHVTSVLRYLRCASITSGFVPFRSVFNTFLAAGVP